MKLRLIISFVALLVLLSSCVSNQGKDDLRLFEGIPSAVIPGACLEYRNDACQLFSCMVDSCWCYDSPGMLLFKASGIVNSNQDAINAAAEYLGEQSAYRVRRAVKLNSVFFNVFAYNADNDEKVLTVAADGTVLKTVCGV
jgi:hypothetical protein